MNQECFVIQPISDTKFTKRYDDIYKPAIEATGLNAYRVDLDPTVKIPIEEIESRIKNSINVLQIFQQIILMFGMN